MLNYKVIMYLHLWYPRPPSLSIYSGSSSTQFPTSQNSHLFCREVLDFFLFGFDCLRLRLKVEKWSWWSWILFLIEWRRCLKIFGMFSLSDCRTLEIILNIYMVCSLESLPYGASSFWKSDYLYIYWNEHILFLDR